MKVQPKKRIRRDARFHKYEPVPDVLIRVGLYLPVDVQIRDIEWGEPKRGYTEWANKAKALLAVQGGAQ